MRNPNADGVARDQEARLRTSLRILLGLALAAGLPTLACAPALYRKFSIDATRDFAGVAMAGISPLVLVVHPSVPARSVAELIALAKAKPGTINFGSGGLGTTPHMAGELFSMQAGVK